MKGGKERSDRKIISFRESISATISEIWLQFFKNTEGKKEKVTEKTLIIDVDYIVIDDDYIINDDDYIVIVVD